jgi:hypothetical protein
MEPSTTVTRSPRAAYRQLTDGSAVILHLDTAAYHSVNETGAAIWEVLEHASTVGAVIDELGSRLDQTPPSLPDDVSEFLGALAERGLVTLSDQG